MLNLQCIFQTYLTAFYAKASVCFVAKASKGYLYKVTDYVNMFAKLAVC